MSATTALLATPEEKAVSNIRDANERTVAALKGGIEQIERIFSNARGTDQKPITREQIITSAGGCLASQEEFIAALKAAVNIAAPGTY